MMAEKYPVVIESPSYGDLNGATIYLTSAMYSRFEKEKSKVDGRLMIEHLKEGTAIQGLKHILTELKIKNREYQLVITENNTHKEGNEYHISYNEYKKKAGARFYDLYRETGLDIASSYLNSYFPDEFEYNLNKLKESEINRVKSEIPDLIKNAPETEKNHLALIEKTTQSLKRSRRKNKHLHLAYEQLQQQSTLTYYQSKLDELTTRLNSKKGFHETKGDDCWQKWIYDNKWLFGTHYLPPIEKEKVGFDSIPDYLFPTFDGFLDILEIKLPKFDVIKSDESHTGSWAWCPDTNWAIGQVVNYLREMEKLQLVVAERINSNYEDDYDMPIYAVKPRAFVLIGNSEKWKPTQHQALRNLNYALHGIQVLTYHDLRQRGEGIVKMIERS
jgi:hypothetical protein